MVDKNVQAKSKVNLLIYQFTHKPQKYHMTLEPLMYACMYVCIYVKK